MAVLAALLALGAGSVAWRAAAAPAPVLLLADTNRDGRLSESDAPGRGDWTTERGAIVVPNLDDDLDACESWGADAQRLGDDALGACGDGADASVNGAADLLDMAPMRVEPVPRAGGYATISVDAAAADRARVFLLDDDGDHAVLGPDDAIGPEQLRAGVDLALEATDMVRDTTSWDGLIDVTLTVQDRGRVETDQVRVRVAPLLLSHDLAPIEELLVADNGTEVAQAEQEGYDPSEPAAPIYDGEAIFREELSAGLASTGHDGSLTEYPTGGDRWMRDQFITGHTAMPGPGGVPHTMTVLLRSAVVDPDGSTADFPLREAGRPVFSVLRGADVAAVQTFSPDRVGQDEYNSLWGSFSSTGNVIVAPPYATESGSWPSGRIVYGSDGGDAAPDPAFVELLEAQRVQDPLAVDTSWLGVGHVDEFLSFTAADNDRGWAAVIADPRLGTRLLEGLVEDGLGDQPLVQRHADGGDADTADMTVAEALTSPELVEGGRVAANGIDAALAVLTEALGLDEASVIRVPAVFGALVVEDYPRQEIVANHMPAIVNGVETGAGAFLAARPHGPVDADGRDVLAAAAETAFASVDGRIAWVEAFDYGHAVGTVGGEIHCLTNTLRDQAGLSPWWQG